jgi:hypothetical protein
VLAERRSLSLSGPVRRRAWSQPSPGTAPEKASMVVLVNDESTNLESLVGELLKTVDPDR